MNHIPGIFFSEAGNEAGIKNFRESPAKCAKYWKIEQFSDESVYIGMSSLEDGGRLFESEKHVLALDGYLTIGEETITSAQKLYDIVSNIDFCKLHEKIVNGTFNMLLYDKKAKTMLFMNDRYNRYLEYYSLEGGKLVIAPRVENIQHSLGRKLKLNTDGVWDLVCFGYLTQDITYFDSVKVLPSASYFKYDLQNHEFTAKEYWKFVSPKVKYKVDLDVLFEKMQKSIDRIPKSENSVLSLSGGMDSRVVHALFDHRDTVTFGIKNCTDINFVKKLPHARGEQIFVDLSGVDETINNMLESVELSEGMNTLYVPSRNLILYKFLRERGYNKYYSGYWGDAVIGGTFFSHLGTSYVEKLKSIMFGLPSTSMTKEEAVRLALAVISKGMKNIRDLDRYLEMVEPFDIITTIEWVKWECKRRQNGCAESAGRNLVYEYYPFMDYELFDYCMGLTYRDRAWRKAYIEMFRKKLPGYCTPSTSTGGLPLYTPHLIMRGVSYIYTMSSSLTKLLTLVGMPNVYSSLDEFYDHPRVQETIKTRLLGGAVIKAGVFDRKDIQDAVKSGNIVLVLNLLTFAIWFENNQRFIDLEGMKKVSVRDWYNI